jgi:uncharacterized membrane protein YdjX (TVP38/TMEM64 family)
MNPRLLVKGLILMASLLAIGWGVKASGLAGHLDSQWVDSEIRGNGAAGWLYYAGFAALAMAVGLPRQAACFLGGYAFGLGEGVLLAEIASGLGCLLSFSYARLLGRDLVRHRFGERLARLDAFLQGHPLSMAMLIRLLPVGNNLITNLLAGVSSVPLLPFLAGSLVGYLPQTVIFVLLGSGIHVQPVWRTAASVALFVASAMLGVVLYRRMRSGKNFDGSL